VSESLVSCLMGIDNGIGIGIEMSMGKEKVHEQSPK
jgi:hypothetical protein